MNANDIRSAFLKFFEEKGHAIVPSSPLVIKNDPTLMFTNAGMNPFKAIFLGETKPTDLRVADTQKCLRVSGKHNDLEEVGVDTYHHTMFEMLGNWSFGDYFKKEAIEWAWELLTEVYKIDKDRLYVTVFGGDAEDGTLRDEEAFDFWKAWIPEDRILYCGKSDNFWEMGAAGPAGPCSEIHVDIRSDEKRKAQPGSELVNQDDPEVIEIWNLVFMEYQRLANRSLVPLEKKHIDTGMGFERLAMILQGKRSNYDSDIFQPLIQKVTHITGVPYTATTDKKSDIAIRVIADHVRAISFSITDGQLPANTGAGYVIRRILRRAVRYAYSFLNSREAFIYRLVPVLAEQMKTVFPELTEQEELVRKVIRQEEESFYKTLDIGISIYEEYVAKLNAPVIDGAFAFRLYDTFGFPIDLTQLMASEGGLEVDLKTFEQHLQTQKKIAREDQKVDAEDWITIRNDEHQEFIGYDHLEADVYITRYRKVIAKKKEQYQLVFNLTPFYPESGGQVGDTGFIADDNGNKVYITDTRKENHLTVHFADRLPDLPNQRFKAVVQGQKRALTCNNHTATHLLHQALREVLGTHVEQKGSLVNSDHLRFDFSHFAKITEKEKEKVEALVNERIRKNISLQEERSVPLRNAIEMGAMALFGEKYNDVVRVVRFNDSVELCGGTHVGSTGQIGLFKIISEGATQAGIRRIEAITSEKAEAYIKKELDALREVRNLLKNPKDLGKSIISLLQQNQQLQKEVETLVREKAKGLQSELLGKMKDVNGVNFLAERVDLDAGAIKDLAFQLKGKTENLFMVLGSESKGKATLTVMISDNLVKSKGLNAGTIVRELAKEIKGGGGGQPFFATAGGKNAGGIPAALGKAETYLA